MFPFEPLAQDNPHQDNWDVDDGVSWVDVSFDGTWQRRDHASHYCIGVVVEVLTGYVIDYHVLSTYCRKCELKERETEVSYLCLMPSQPERISQGDTHFKAHSLLEKKKQTWLTE